MAYKKTHQPCPTCGSSDAISIKEDGSSYCFSCQEDLNAPDELVEEPMTHQVMKPAYLSSGKSLPLPDRKITKETCQAYNVTVEGTQQYYPYYNEDGEWVANKI